MRIIRIIFRIRYCDFPSYLRWLNFLDHSISHNLLDIHFFKYLRCTNFLNVSIFSGVLFFKWFFAFSVFVQYKFSLILFKFIFQAHVYYSSSRWYKTATLRSEIALSDTNRRLESGRDKRVFFLYLSFTLRDACDPAISNCIRYILEIFLQ